MGINKFVGQSKMMNIMNNTFTASPISARERATARPIGRPMAADQKKRERSISKKRDGMFISALALNTNEEIKGGEEKADERNVTFERSKTINLQEKLRKM